MRRQKIEISGFAYRRADEIEVYLKLPNGKFVKCVGDAKKAERSFGRVTRPVKESFLGR